jgi:hypothetical protein
MSSVKSLTAKMQDLKDLTRLEDDYLLFIIRRASLEERSTWEKTTDIYNYCTNKKRTSDSLRGRHRAILKDGKIRNVVKNEVKRAWWTKKEKEIVALVRREVNLCRTSLESKSS